MNAVKATLLCSILLTTGCAVGLPRGPIEPSVTNDCMQYMRQSCSPQPCPAEGACGQACPCEEEGAECDCPGEPCAPKGCPLLPPGPPVPPYVDPGPPGRFLPVPVQPVFAPRTPMMGGPLLPLE